MGHRVLKIKRYRVGPVELGEMQPGEARKLGRRDTAWMLERRPRPRGRGRGRGSDGTEGAQS